ncbi:MAG TPA: FG-GAP-like repeat-containing protein [Ignavibacteriaceae bacterium]|nr:FG-GAP-like repeat-containing protein [Ignavibacteriaceae bacterium]
MYDSLLTIHHFDPKKGVIMIQYIILIALLISSSSLPQINFTVVKDSSNPITTFTGTVVYRGAAWIDVNNDNKADLFVCPDKLFINNGVGNFTSVTTPIGEGQTQNPSGCTWGDFNNDGYIDCFLARNPSRLYLNDKQGNFIADDSAFSVPGNYPGWACSFSDYNNDGILDLVIAHPAGFLGPSFPSFLFKGTAQFMLQNDTSYLFTKQLGPYTVPYFSDFDMDGDEDLFIASGPGGSPGKDYLYKNLLKETGNDSLTRITDLPFAIDQQDGQCYNFIDYDNDGDLDLCITNWRGMKNRFYKNNNGTYNEITVPFDYNSGSLSNAWGDFDNDGDLDVIITNDQIKNTEAYMNNGDGTFTLVAGQLSALTGSGGTSLGDYDNDGDLDLFVMGTTAGKGLFRNEAQQNNNHWINIRCEGTASNRSAIGTKVKLKTVIGGKAYWQYREISAQNTFQGQNDLRVHFGLGDATMVDSLIIIYPSSTTEYFINLTPGKFYHNTEGTHSLDIITSIDEHSNDEIYLTGFTLYQNYPNPFNPSTTIKYKLEKSVMVKLSIYDMLGNLVTTLADKVEEPGEHSVEFNAKELSSGVYFYRLDTGEQYFSKAMMLVK